jgi:hypothetical protein
MTFIDMEYSKLIEDFPNYSITDTGRVFNNRNRREMVLSPTENGDLTVGLTRESRQYRYSVKCLVARAFVEGESDLFNTPIQLDGDKYNLNADNIQWRPRWFAWKYTHQFNKPHNWYFFGPIVDIDTMIEYRDYIIVAKTFGLLCSNIMESIYNDRLVFPTHQKFAYIQ